METNNSLEITKQLLKNGKISQEIAETIFPQLKESDDEKIRNAIIDFFSEPGRKEYILKGFTVNDILAWLEKQGEKNPITFNNAHTIDSALNDYCCEQYHALHKENGGVLSFARLQHLAMDIYGWCEKQNLANSEKTSKVEPKFKVGDWVVLSSETLQIVKIDLTSNYYWFNDNSFLAIVDDDCLHPWTIQDAKDGDVLVASDNSIFILKNVVNNDCICYIALSTDNTITLEDYWEVATAVHPATKEQYNLLFQKMKEAGYEWDAEKKELKMIEQKPAWSEEDEHRITDTIYFLETAKKHYAGTEELDNCIDWLKSFKERVLPQIKPSWSEKDEKMFEFWNLYYEHKVGDMPNKDVVENLEKFRDWLISIKSRVQLKSKSEWSEEDEKNFTTASVFIKNTSLKDVDEIKASLISWIKSLKERYTWKPTEEQMLRLKGIVDSMPHQKELFSLYIDLKKLKG